VRAFLFCLVSARCFPGLCPNRPRGIGGENPHAGEKPRLGFVCPAKKPRNIYRANGALRLFVLPIFGFCPWKTQQAALPRAFAKRNGHTQQTLPGGAFAVPFAAKCMKKVDAALWDFPNFQTYFQTYKETVKSHRHRARWCAPFSFAHFWGSA